VNGRSGGYDDITHPYASERAMDNDGQSGIRQNELYVSSDDTMVIENTASNSNNVYAEVQKKFKSENKENTKQEQNGAELSDLNAPGPVYAEVKKPKSKQTVEEETCPSRYKNQDGLLYARVDIQNGDSSQPPIPPPKRFSDAQPDPDRVVYSDVTTGI